MNISQIEQLIEAALCARKKAYTPYSHFCVGAALLAKNGIIYTGCNIENAAHTPANCAERTAFFKAVSEEVRDFSAIAVVGGQREAQKPEIISPCGVCRQVMAEFCAPDFEIILAASKEEYKIYTLNELLPFGFGPNALGGAEECS